MTLAAAWSMSRRSFAARKSICRRTRIRSGLDRI
jgi:hypothetical protein